MGVPVLLAAFLGCCRRNLIAGKHNSLTRATRFLTEDYRKGAFYWELVDLLRKLFLTGFLLVLVPQDLSLLRLVVALLLSIGYLALLGVADPHKDRSTGFLNIGLQLSLCFFLTAAMLLKVMPLVSSVAERSSLFGWSSAFPLTVVILCLNFGVCGMALLVFLHRVRMPRKSSPSRVSRRTTEISSASDQRRSAPIDLGLDNEIRAVGDAAGLLRGFCSIS